MNKQRRSYFANTVEAAMTLARGELGDDALLVSSREAGEEQRHLGAYEVVVDVDAGGGEAPPSASRSFELGGLSGEITSLKREMERMAAMLTSMAARTRKMRPELARVAAHLEASDMPQDLVGEILDWVERRNERLLAGQGGPGATVLQALAAELASRLKVSPGLGRENAERRIVALVGPPGAGKTTTLAKLAMQFGVAARASTAILTTDTYRIGAADQLRSYASILGLNCQVAETPGALQRLLEEHRSRQLVFIDTPGFARKEWDLASHWAGALRSQPEIEVQLVLSATARSSDLLEMAERWDVFQPRRLVFTQVDETRRAGGMLSCAMKTSRPISFLGTGQAVPEDLRPATLPDLLAMLMDERRGHRAAAA